MSKVAISVFAIVLFSGCAQSSGVLTLGPDTYTVSVHAAPARGGESGARNLALSEANVHCQSQDREIMVTNLSSGPSSHFPGGTVEVTFRCLERGDPELQRPTFRKAPDITIEDRRGGK
jgi:hypothetical protein